MFVTNWISTTKIQKISEITNFFRHYFLSRTEVCCAHVHHVLCSRSSAVVRSSVYTETKLPNPLEKVGWGIVFRAHVQGVKKVWNSVICAICMSFFLFFFCLHIFFLTFAIVKYISNASTHSKYK